MQKTVETTGKTIDDAISAALLELKAEREDVSVEVIEKPKTGFLGLGGTLAKVRVVYNLTKESEAQRFLEGLFEHMDIMARPEVSVREDGSLKADLKGENLGILIGRRGDTLDAIQHITANVINRGGESGEWTRIVVDIENYRQKREESLARLARSTATKVAKTRRNITLEPMNAYERHVIHSSLQEWRDVTTFSSGTEPRRCVVIAYGKQRPGETGARPFTSGAPRPSGQRSGGYQRSGGQSSGGYSNSRPSGGYQRHNNSSDAPKYAGKSNFSGGVQRYGYSKNDAPAADSAAKQSPISPGITKSEDDSL